MNVVMTRDERREMPYLTTVIGDDLIAKMKAVSLRQFKVSQPVVKGEAKIGYVWRNGRKVAVN